MCDIRPGTRCAYDMRSKVQKRTQKLEEALSKYGEGSPEALLAQERLYLAERQYDATKEGIKKIEKLITQTDYDEDLIQRYKEAKITNSTQTLSVKEIKTNRQTEIAFVNSAIYGTDSHEAFSVLESARTFQENKIISTKNEELLEPVESGKWRGYLANLSYTLKSEGRMTPELEKTLTHLSKTSAPPAYIYGCYSNYDKLNQLSIKHKNDQQKMIATLIGSDLETVKKAHRQLRESYLRMENKPTIPEQWVRGESSTAGTMNSPRLRYAPSDPASAYANYSLMYNNDALPDYQKRAHNFVSIEQDQGSISLSRYSPTGKLLYVEDYAKDSPNLLSQIKQETEGSILITEHPTRTGLSLEEIASQHLDLPSYTKQNVRAALKSDTNNTVELFLKTYASSKKVWNSKKDRKSLLV